MITEKEVFQYYLIDFPISKIYLHIKKVFQKSSKVKETP